jgi:hypothetical protein
MQQVSFFPRTIRQPLRVLRVFIKKLKSKNQKPKNRKLKSENQNSKNRKLKI